MIAVRPGKPAFDVLRLVVNRPGQLTAEDIGQTLWRPRVTGTANYLAVRAAIRDGSAEWTTRASDLLNRLRQRGLVERQRPPFVAEEWTELAAEDPREVVANAAEGDGPIDPTGLRAALLAELVRRAPATMADWVGAAPSGNINRAVADLVEWGVVIHPLRRWPTDAGVELVTNAEAA
jgi:hypothetical protein